MPSLGPCRAIGCEKQHHAFRLAEPQLPGPISIMIEGREPQQGNAIALTQLPSSRLVVQLSVCCKGVHRQRLLVQQPTKGRNGMTRF